MIVKHVRFKNNNTNIKILNKELKRLFSIYCYNLRKLVDIIDLHNLYIF